jgi:hypothetical protein
MSWAGLANNQTISFNNLQNAVTTGVFSQKASIPVSTEQITKDDANIYVNINTSFAPYAAKASNQLVVKSNLEAVLASVVFTNGIIWFGIANNQTTSSPIQLLCGWNDSNDDGRIYRSTDYGSTYASVLTINQRLYRVRYLPAFRHASTLTVLPFVAVGEGGRIVTNNVTDCTSYVTVTSPTTQDLFDIAFNSTQAIIVGDARILKTTTANRINAWTIVNSASNIWRSVASNGSIFVAVGNSSAIITGDSAGTTWTARSMPPLTPTKNLKGITYHTDGFFYVVGQDASTGDPYMMRSSDNGVTWSNYLPTGATLSLGLQSIESINNKLIIGGINSQYEIDGGVARQFTAAFAGYSAWWMSAVKDANSNGFDMAASLVVFGNEFNGQHGGHSNF